MADRPWIGARWDDSSENPRFLLARRNGLLEYVEVNYPVSLAEAPEEIGLPIFAHTSNNALCNASGIDYAVAERVRDGATKANSPWVGEHLALLGYASTGALGYVINPLFIHEFAEVAVANAKNLCAYYQRPVALELGPLYTLPLGDYRSELDFLGDVAERANANIILDLTHWTISNKNLRRQLNFGLDHLPLDRIIELHIAGMRKSATQDVWHDAHGMPLGADILSLLAEIAGSLPKLRAVTLEHSAEKPADDFLFSLEQVHAAMRGSIRY